MGFNLVNNYNNVHEENNLRMPSFLIVMGYDYNCFGMHIELKISINSIICIIITNFINILLKCITV